MVEYESKIESECISIIQSYTNNDLPKISRARKNLNRAHSDLNALEIKYDSLKKSMENSSQLSQFQVTNNNKLESLRKDLDDNQNKVTQCRVINIILKA